MQRRLDDSTLLSLVLVGMPQADIAKKYGMSTSAVCRRINDPIFQEQLSAHRRAVLDSCLSKLTDTANEAVEVLSELLQHKNGYLRFSAASRILSLVQDLSVQEDLLKEIETLKKNQESTISGRG